MTVSSRPISSATYAAARLPDGAWRITIPGVPPSQNTLDREHWRVRHERVRSITDALTLLRRSYRLPAPVFELAQVDTQICYSVKRRHDEPNALGGLKQHVDALVRAGWVLDDDTEHLRFSIPELSVDRPARVEFTLRPAERSDAL